MKYLIHLLCYFLINCNNNIQSLPIVDKGVFVITGVKTCQGGLGYCILGNDCTVDKEFVLDTLGGHCEGLRKAFTPRTFFTCCQYNDLNLTTTTTSTTTTTTVKSTTIITNDVSLESNETIESESNESIENITENNLFNKQPIGIISLSELLLQNGTTLTLELDPEPNSDSIANKLALVITTEKVDSIKLTESTSSSTTTGQVQTESTTTLEGESSKPIQEVVTIPIQNNPEVELTQVQTLPTGGGLAHNKLELETNPPAQPSILIETSPGQAQPSISIETSPGQPLLQEGESSSVQSNPEIESSSIQSILEVESTPVVQTIPESESNPIDLKKQDEHKPLLELTKPQLEYVHAMDADTNLIEIKTSPAPTVQPIIIEVTPEITFKPEIDNSNPHDDLDGSIYLKEDNLPSNLNFKISNQPESQLVDYRTCGIPQMKQKEIRVATVDSNEMNEQVGGDIGSCWLGGLVRSPTSLFSINDPGSYICSGALISENTFLTSATCISRLIGNDLKLFRIILGTKHIIHPSNGVTYNGIYREIINYNIHTNYSVIGQLRFHDIGIIQLKSRTLLEAFRQDEMQYCTLCLPKIDTDFDKCIVSGYSHPSPSNGQDSDGIVHEAEQYIETSKYCESIINSQKLSYNYDGFTCASGVANGEACFSPRDAGSPLACNMNNTSKYFIAGLFSSGFHCGTHDAPIIYTNIKHYLNWIYQNA